MIPMINSLPNLAFFKEIYEGYYQKIYHYVYSCLLNRQDAEDVTSEIFFAIWDNLDRYDQKRGKLSTWIGTIARHRVQDFWKKAYIGREILTEEIPDCAVEPKYFHSENDSLKQSENIQLYLMFQRLSLKERDFLELRYGLELKNEEIAELLGISRDAVRVRYDRLLKKCRQLLTAILSKKF